MAEIPDRYKMRYEQLVNTPMLNRVPYFHDEEISHILEVASLEQQNAAFQQRVDDALAANELDRRNLHAVVKNIDEEINGRMWLIESRGPYKWDDDRFRKEFGWAVHALQEKLEPLRKIASDLTNSPKQESGVERVRKLEALEQQVARMREALIAHQRCHKSNWDFQETCHVCDVTRAALQPLPSQPAALEGK